MPRSRDHSQRLGTKKWTGSKANQYVSRSKACKKLQIALVLFTAYPKISICTDAHCTLLSPHSGSCAF